MGILKFEKFEELLLAESQKKNTHIQGDKKMFQGHSLNTTLYVCKLATVSTMYSHHQAEHVAGLHTVKMCLDCERTSFLFSWFTYNQKTTGMSCLKRRIHNGDSITTEERLALTVTLVRIPYNLLSPPSSEQLNTSQRQQLSD